MEANQDVLRWASENKIIPFPSEVKNSEEGSLEYYFNILPKIDRLIRYEDLPDVISSNSIDPYLTWLSALTQKDEQHRERGTFIHLKDNKMVYPVNPVVGEERQVNPYPHYSGNPKILPVLRVHSHPDRSCFSTADLKRAMTDDEFIADGLGSKGQNFIILRTDETTMDNIDDVRRKIDETNDLIQSEGAKIYDALDSSELPKDVVNYIKMLVNNEDNLRFGRDFATHLISFTITQAVAENYKLGFYYSNQDGIFRRFTNEDVEQIMEDGKSARIKVLEDIGKASSKE